MSLVEKMAAVAAAGSVDVGELFVTGTHGFGYGGGLWCTPLVECDSDDRSMHRCWSVVIEFADVGAARAGR